MMPAIESLRPPLPETQILVLIHFSNRNLDRASTSAYFTNHINKIARHLSCAFTNQLAVLDDQSIGHLNGIDITVFNAVNQRVEITAVPVWRSNRLEECLINVVSSLPGRTIENEFLPVIP